MKKEDYNITGMTCSSCSSRVEKKVGQLEGIQKVSVNLLTNHMQVEYDESLLNQQKIITTIETAGYGATIQGTKPETLSLDQNIKVRLWTSLVLLIPMMYISMAPMLNQMFFIPIPYFMTQIFYGSENGVAYAFSQFLLLLPILYLNRNYYKIGFRNLFHASPNMDTLIAVGSSAGVIYGVVGIIAIGYGLGHNEYHLVERFTNDLYFESAGMIVTLITLGKYLESKSKGKTSAAIEKLVKLAPKEAMVERDGKIIKLAVESIVVGDIIHVKPGERIAVDGIVVEGRTSIDESAITGESIPVEKKDGDVVVSATINKTGYIRFKATKVGADTTISRIIQLVEEASGSKAPIARLADKIAGIFVPIVMLLAFLAVVVWLIAGASISFALSIGITVLVISCPCALGLATPVAIMVGTGKGAECGILFKSGEALEIAHKIDTVVLDKTVTITEGIPKLTDMKCYEMEKEQLLAIASGLETKSEHPLAEAILAYANEHQIKPLEMNEFEAVFGKGILAEYQGEIYCAGNEALLQEKGISTDAVEKQIQQYADEGKTPLLFANSQKVIGIIAVADVEKESSKNAIAELQAMSIEVVMLTGDHSRTAKAIQQRMGIQTVIAQVLPDEKEQHIARLQAEGRTVAMIGDGINDAPALARANLGMAIGAGTDIAIESADAILVRNDLMDAVGALRLGRAVIRNIKENLFWAFFYNAVGIPLAMGVLYPIWGLRLTPMFGAAAMSLSSICVVANALRLRSFSANRKSRKR